MATASTQLGMVSSLRHVGRPTWRMLGIATLVALLLAMALDPSRVIADVAGLARQLLQLAPSTPVDAALRP